MGGAEGKALRGPDLAWLRDSVAPNTLGYCRGFTGHTTFVVLLNFGSQTETYDVVAALAPGCTGAYSAIESVRSGPYTDDGHKKYDPAALSAIKVGPLDGKVLQLDAECACPNSGVANFFPARILH